MSADSSILERWTRPPCPCPVTRRAALRARRQTAPGTPLLDRRFVLVRPKKLNPEEAVQNAPAAGLVELDDHPVALVMPIDHEHLPVLGVACARLGLRVTRDLVDDPLDFDQRHAAGCTAVADPHNKVGIKVGLPRQG